MWRWRTVLLLWAIVAALTIAALALWVRADVISRQHGVVKAPHGVWLTVISTTATVGVLATAISTAIVFVKAMLGIFFRTDSDENRHGFEVTR